MNDPIDRLNGFGDPSTPVGALAEFYEAFNSRNLELMAGNWLQSPEASMSNPLGGVKRGWDEIRSVYQTIFSGHARVRVEFHDYEIFERDGFFQAVGRERGTLVMDDKSLTLRIRTSRCFVRQGGRFLQLHHHGSVDEPTLLEGYQSALRTGKLS